MKYESVPMYRTVKVDGVTQELSITVKRPIAESSLDCLELAGQSLEKVLEYFNAGYWQELRNQEGNKLVQSSRKKSSKKS